MLWRLVVLSSLVAGCATSSQAPAEAGSSVEPVKHVAAKAAAGPSAKPPGRRRSSWDVFIPKHLEGEAPRPFFGLALADELKPEAPPRPVAPEGVACAIYGAGTGLVSECNPHMTVVHDVRAGGRAIATFNPEGAEVAWGVLPGKGHGWVHHEDDTFVLDGFADLSKETFTLLREVSIVDEHVWLKQGIPVGILGAEKTGVAVSFEDTLPGVDSVAARVPCDALLFEPAPPKPEPDPAAMEVELEYASPSVELLTLYRSPGGSAITTIGKKDEALPVSFEVVERKPEWMRVRFETEKAKFDVWAKSAHLDADWGSMAGMGFAGCGMSRCGGGHPSLSTVARPTPVIVGDGPDYAPSPGITVRKGAQVMVLSERGDYVEIRGYGSRIGAPDGASFWIPKSAIENMTES